MENTSKNKQLVAAITVIIAIAVGLYIYRDMRGARSGGELGQTPRDNSSTGTTTIPVVGSATFKSANNTSIPLPQPVPKLSRTMPTNTLPADAQAIITANIAKYSTELAKDPWSAESWIFLGVQYKIAGDYAGAREAWGYAGRLAPTSVVPFYNLGDIYYSYLKDTAKSEQNFRIAITNDPSYIASYRALHDLYIYAYPAKKGEATAVLLEGLKKNPGNIDLLILLATDYKNVGDTANARTYFKQALAGAQKKGNTTLVATITAEITALK